MKKPGTGPGFGGSVVGVGLADGDLLEGLDRDTCGQHVLDLLLVVLDERLAGQDDRVEVLPHLADDHLLSDLFGLARVDGFLLGVGLFFVDDVGGDVFFVDAQGLGDRRWPYVLTASEGGRVPLQPSRWQALPGGPQTTS